MTKQWNGSNLMQNMVASVHDNLVVVGSVARINVFISSSAVAGVYIMAANTTAVNRPSGNALLLFYLFYVNIISQTICIFFYIETYTYINLYVTGKR